MAVSKLSLAMTSRSNHALRQAARHAPLALVIALDLALIGALAVAAAYCTWVWFAPRAKAAPALAVESRAQDAPSAAARRLFAGAAPQAASTTAVRLIGVVAPGRALFIAENGRPRTVAPGESIGELELREVHPDHVVVSRGGSRERLSLVRGNASR
jgi:type II secretion system (T2SS) protein C